MTFDALKVLIIVPIESCDDVVEAPFYGSCQLPAMQESEIIVTCKYHELNHINMLCSQFALMDMLNTNSYLYLLFNIVI